MNIISVNQNTGHSEFYLKEDERPVLRFRYNREAHTARIQTVIGRRLLIIEDEGLLKTRLVLKNEYGVGIGALQFNNFSDHHGSVEIEKTRFRFSIKEKDKSSKELQIFKHHESEAHYHCFISVGEEESTIEYYTGHQAYKNQSASYVIAVSWYLYLKSMGGEKPVEKTDPLAQPFLQFIP